MYPPVKTKRDFVRRYIAGEFGNRPLTWGTLDEYCRWHESRVWADPLRLARVHLRNRIAGGSTYYDLLPGTAADLWRRVPNPQNWYLSMMGPESQKIFQGEVIQSPWGVELTYSTLALPMREAFALNTHFSRGIIGVSLLRHFLCPNSFDWLEVLWDRYPNHVVEFSTYSTNWGTLPNFNTVFWEVRNY